jgi:hypothetical protein
MEKWVADPSVMTWIVVFCLSTIAFIIGGRELPRRRYRRWCFYGAIASITALLWVAYGQYQANQLMDVSPIEEE